MPRASSALYSDDLAAALARATALDPEERFASTAELRAALCSAPNELWVALPLGPAPTASCEASPA